MNIYYIQVRIENIERRSPSNRDLLLMVTLLFLVIGLTGVWDLLRWRAPAVGMPLPVGLRSSSFGLDTFAKHLKTHLFGLAYSRQGTHFWVCVTFCRVRHGDSVTKPDYYYYYYYYYYLTKKKFQYLMKHFEKIQFSPSSGRSGNLSSNKSCNNNNPNSGHELNH